MRVEPYATGSVVHVLKRGARGMDIVMDDADKWRFTKSLFILNDVYSHENWHRLTSDLPLFERPVDWPRRETLTRILAWALMPNHLHLLLQEKVEKGISKFMQRLCGSMSMCFNAKYESKGSIFQGAYKAKVVDNDSYLRYLVFYIQVKNVLELYPGGLVKAVENFDKAWDWAISYQFSSLPNYVLGTGSPIIDDAEGLMVDIHERTLSKQDAYEMLRLYVTKSEAWSSDNRNRHNRLQELVLE